jgi:hypothetical protein
MCHGVAHCRQNFPCRRVPLNSSLFLRDNTTITYTTQTPNYNSPDTYYTFGRTADV